ncbi:MULTISPECIES: response regulator transcription factor [Emticicia]|uniref:response regulator transcription factor n=1 Tax=Emticicia TaxID=312278 RepID=UPI000C772982|nr:MULTISPECIES: response regulator transcription factor [Emticicia]PLK45465.1 DNA-binding response regulator [Emticicia sp. TH156]UTA69579.1 response regulator transcription factor [Emticicia sp. 21SJ11W-3]
MSNIRIAVVDDHSLFRKGMISILEQVSGFEVVMEATNGLELLHKLQHTTVDVILMDIQMPQLDGTKATEIVKEKFPKTKVLILSMHDEDKYVMHMMETGASGYLLKDSDPEEVEKAIKKVVETGTYFSDFASKVMLRKMTRKNQQEKKIFNYKTDLSEREEEVLKHICDGLSTVEIGDKMSLSPRTVEGHRLRMIEKLGVKNTAGLVAFAIKNHLV